jgi:hypothetical protein
MVWEYRIPSSYIINRSNIQAVHDEVKKYESLKPDDGGVHYVAGLLTAINLLGLDHKNGCTCDPFPCEEPFKHKQNLLK